MKYETLSNATAAFTWQLFVNMYKISKLDVQNNVMQDVMLEQVDDHQQNKSRVCYFDDVLWLLFD